MKLRYSIFRKETLNLKVVNNYKIHIFSEIRSLKIGCGLVYILFSGSVEGGILYTSTAPLPMRHSTMGYTSMRYTTTALYFYEENIQAPNNFF